MSNQKAGAAGNGGSAVVGLVLLFACAAFGFYRLSGTLGLMPNTSPHSSSSVPAPQNGPLPQISNPPAVTVGGMPLPADQELEEIVELFHHELIHLMPDTTER